MDLRTLVPLPGSQLDLHGRLRLRATEERPVVVVFVDEPSSESGAHLFADLSESLYDAGISSFRFDDEDFDRHSGDLDAVVRHLKDRRCREFKTPPVVVVAAHGRGTDMVVESDEHAFDGLVLIDVNDDVSSAAEALCDFDMPVFAVAAQNEDRIAIAEQYLSVVPTKEKRILPVPHADRSINADNVDVVADHMKFAVRRVVNASQAGELLDMEAIEEEVHEVLVLVARQEEIINGKPGAMTRLNALLGERYEDVMLHEVQGSRDIDQLVSHRTERREVLRSRLRRVVSAQDRRSENLLKWLLAEAAHIRATTDAIARLMANPAASA